MFSIVLDWPLLPVVATVGPTVYTRLHVSGTYAQGAILGTTSVPHWFDAFRRLPRRAWARKRELSMPENKQERWRELCEMAVLETNPLRVAELFRQIDELLSETEPGPRTDALQSDAA